MWGGAGRGHAKRSLVEWTAEGSARSALLRGEGVAISTSTVGRILRKLMDRGVVVPVPTLRRNPAARRIPLTQSQRYAHRLPKGLNPNYDPVAQWTLGHVANKATATSAATPLGKPIRDTPFPIKGIQVDGGSDFKAAFATSRVSYVLNSVSSLRCRRPRL